MKESEVKIICDSIDQLITTSIGGKFAGYTNVDYIPALAKAAREKQKGAATYLAAKKLRDAIKPRDRVIIGTGWILAHYMAGETDGPPGAATLARALDLGLDARPVIITEPELNEICAAACKGAGLRIFPLERTKEIPRRVSIINFTPNKEEARKRASKLLDELNPSALISVEKGSRNMKGIYHSLWGLDISPTTSPVDILFEESKDRGILTVGIGDGGNEIGCGLIADTINKLHPKGTKCDCPCGAGITATTVTDVLVIAFVSNWGAYGIEAALSLLLDREDVLHTGKVEEYVLQQTGLAGAVSSPYGYSGPDINQTRVDQMPGEISVKIVELLNYMVYSYMCETRLRKWYQRPPAEQLERMQRWLKEGIK
jgi:hypothetical protein